MKTQQLDKGCNSATFRELFNERLLTKMQTLILARIRSNKTINQMAEYCDVSRYSIMRFEHYKLIDPYLVFCYTQIFSHGN